MGNIPHWGKLVVVRHAGNICLGLINLYTYYIHGVWSVRYCVGGGRWVKYWRQWWVMRHARPWEGRGRGAAVGVINIGGRVVGLDSPNYADVRNPGGVSKI